MKNIDCYNILKCRDALKRDNSVKQGDIVFVVGKTENRTGWYQKLRCANNKVNYVKVFPSSDNPYNVYSQDTIEKYDGWSSVNDGYPYITYIVCGGENVAKVIQNEFDISEALKEEKILNLNNEYRILANAVDEFQFRMEQIREEFANLNSK